METILNVVIVPYFVFVLFWKLQMSMLYSNKFVNSNGQWLSVGNDLLILAILFTLVVLQNCDSLTHSPTHIRTPRVSVLSSSH